MCKIFFSKIKYFRRYGILKFASNYQKFRKNDEIYFSVTYCSKHAWFFDLILFGTIYTNKNETKSKIWNFFKLSLPSYDSFKIAKRAILCKLWARFNRFIMFFCLFFLYLRHHRTKMSSKTDFQNHPRCTGAWGQVVFRQKIQKCTNFDVTYIVVTTLLVKYFYKIY